MYSEEVEHAGGWPFVMLMACLILAKPGVNITKEAQTSSKAKQGHIINKSTVLEGLKSSMQYFISRCHGLFNVPDEICCEHVSEPVCATLLVQVLLMVKSGRWLRGRQSILRLSSITPEAIERRSKPWTSSQQLSPSDKSFFQVPLQAS